MTRAQVAYEAFHAHPHAPRSFIPWARLTREERAPWAGAVAAILRDPSTPGAIASIVRAQAALRATHRCKVCRALWRLNDPTPEQPNGSWSCLTLEIMGKCCDNVAMGDQIEPFALLSDPDAHREFPEAFFQPEPVR